MKKLILMCMFVFLTELSAGNIFVDTKNGVDTNKGTQDSPYLSWNKAVSMMNQNDIIKSVTNEKPEIGIAKAIILRQDDKKIENQIVDKGTWKERIVKNVEQSSNAGLKISTKYKYEIGETKTGKKYMRCVGIETIVE